jgi:diguanylate cyclase (GGDEF)-like protein
MITRLEALLTHWLRRIAIRYRLIGSLILVSVLPLLASGYISFHESSQAIKDKAQVFATEIVKQVSKNAQLRMAGIEANTEALVLSDRVQTELIRYASDDPDSKAQARAEMPTLLLRAYGSFDHVNQKYFLDKDHQIMDSQVFSQLGRNVVQFVEKAPHLKGRPYWGTLDVWSGQKNIVILRDIYFKANNQLAGSLFLGIKRAHFSEIFDDVNLGRGSRIYMLDANDGSLIVEGQESAAMTNDHRVNPALLAAIRQTLQGGQSTGSMTYENTTESGTSGRQNGKFVTVFAAIANTPWFVVNEIPYDSLVAEARSVRDKIILMVLVCFVCVILLSYIISRSISAPLKQLVERMNPTETGSFLVQTSHEGKDELTVLSQKFSDMAQKIRLEHEQLEERVTERTHDLEEANQKLATLSTTDALTGIANRRRFDEVLASEWSRAARLGKPLALGMIDIDWFKNYNDHYGHQAGDECLRRVAEVFDACILRTGDMLARYGGEEFVFIAPGADGDNVLRIARHLCEALQAAALPHALSGFGCVTASIGVAARVPTGNEGPETLVMAADLALYRAKAQGRNQVVAAIDPINTVM